jgi:hypothetical protein
VNHRLEIHMHFGLLVNSRKYPVCITRRFEFSYEIHNGNNALSLFTYVPTVLKVCLFFLLLKIHICLFRVVVDCGEVWCPHGDRGSRVMEFR